MTRYYPGRGGAYTGVVLLEVSLEQDSLSTVTHLHGEDLKGVVPRQVLFDPRWSDDVDLQDLETVEPRVDLKRFLDDVELVAVGDAAELGLGEVRMELAVV